MKMKTYNLSLVIKVSYDNGRTVLDLSCFTFDLPEVLCLLSNFLFPTSNIFTNKHVLLFTFLTHTFHCMSSLSPSLLRSQLNQSCAHTKLLKFSLKSGGYRLVLRLVFIELVIYYKPIPQSLPLFLYL